MEKLSRSTRFCIIIDKGNSLQCVKRSFNKSCPLATWYMVNNYIAISSFLMDLELNHCSRINGISVACYQSLVFLYRVRQSARLFATKRRHSTFCCPDRN